jgi:putative aldouronate transport system substrate-binding protein
MTHRLFRFCVVGLALLVLATAAFATGTPGAKQAPEIKTITVARYEGAGLDNFSDTAVGQLILDELGIRVEELSKVEAAQAVITDMAAGNLPDLSVFWAGAEDPVFLTMVKGATEGQLAPLEDAIRNYSPVLTEVLDRDLGHDDMAGHFFRPEFNGEIYIMPTHYGLTTAWVSGYGLYIRGDVADQLGIPTPDYAIETTDDFIEVLTKIKNAGIKDVNGNPAYPMGGMTWDGVLYGSIGRPFSFGGSAFMGIENGKVKSFIKSDYAWENIEFIRTLLDEGLLDPEMFTDSGQRRNEKIAQGRFSVWPIFASFSVDIGSPAYVQSLLTAAPQMGYRPLGNMLNYMGNRDTFRYNSMAGGLAWSASADTDIEAAIKLVDWINTWDGRASLRYGVKDVHWFENAKGYPQMFPEPYAAILADPEAFASEVGAVLNGSALYLLSEATGLDYEPYDVTTTGQDDDRHYQNSPARLNSIIAAREAVMPNDTVTTQKPLDTLFPGYPNWAQFKPAWDQRGDIMFQCYLVDSDAEARAILENYRATLDRNGYADFIAYLQKAYDSDPDSYSGYITW